MKERFSFEDTRGNWNIIEVQIRETVYEGTDWIWTINPLALDLDIYSLAHHLCKM
jgi:hypothetical protein